MGPRTDSATSVGRERSSPWGAGALQPGRDVAEGGERRDRTELAQGEGLGAEKPLQGREVDGEDL